MSSLIQPPTTPLADFANAILAKGYAILSSADLRNLAACSEAELVALQVGWNTLPSDDYLKDGGHYRRRRHGSFILEKGQLRQVPHRAHYQPVAYNALHGGMHRWFAPITDDDVKLPAWSKLLQSIGALCSSVKETPIWYVEAHQFRIDTTGGIGRPTPEGAHRDGVDFVAILLVQRSGIKGGESRVFDADGPFGQRFTLTEPWSLLLLDDHRILHETTPIQPQVDGGYRDTLVLTFRRDQFLSSNE